MSHKSGALPGSLRILWNGIPRYSDRCLPCHCLHACSVMGFRYPQITHLPQMTSGGKQSCKKQALKAWGQTVLQDLVTSSSVSRLALKLNARFCRASSLPLYMKPFILVHMPGALRFTTCFHTLSPSTFKMSPRDKQTGFITVLHKSSWFHDLTYHKKGLEVFADKHPSYSTPMIALTQHSWVVTAGYTCSCMYEQFFWLRYQCHKDCSLVPQYHKLWSSVTNAWL